MIKVYVASAFSKDEKGGNKAGVLINDYNLTVKQKMKIAEILWYSETAFISKSDKADFKLEYFTPVEEVPLCGHATIATFVVLNNLRKLSKSSYKIETKSGILNIKIDKELILMQQNLPKYYEIIDKNELEKCIDINMINREYPIQIVSTGLKDILVPIDNGESLRKMKPNFEEMKKISKEKDVIGMHMFTLNNDEELTAICRNFAPLYGINEESATGTSNCALACYLFKCGIKKNKYVFEQGYELNNPSQIIVFLEEDNNQVSNVLVGGKGYIVEELEINNLWWKIL